MATTEDTFHIYIVITGEHGEEIIKKQLAYIDENDLMAAPHPNFAFDRAYEFMNKLARASEDIELD